MAKVKLSVREIDLLVYALQELEKNDLVPVNGEHSPLIRRLRSSKTRSIAGKKAWVQKKAQEEEDRFQKRLHAECFVSGANE
jgi:hypothetical protein